MLCVLGDRDPQVTARASLLPGHPSIIGPSSPKDGPLFCQRGAIDGIAGSELAGCS